MTASETVVTIHGAAVSLTATYRVPLVVNGGSGGGLYPEQTQAAIEADTPPEGMVFSGWTGDTGTVADVLALVTTVGVQDAGLTLTATYAYWLPLVLGDGTLAFTPTGEAASVIVAPGVGPSGGPAVCFTNLTDSQSAGVEAEVTGAGRIVFQWRIGSEAEADFMLFRVDGDTLASYSGKNKPWVAVTNQVTGAGPHTLCWEYVAGSNPTNSESVLRAELETADGVQRVTWSPDLGTARVYAVEGRALLTEGAWGATNAASRFFRIEVSMP